MLVATAVALQAVLSRGIPALGVVGAHAAAVNLAGQAVIHGIAVTAPLVAPVVAGGDAVRRVVNFANAVGSIGEEDASKTQRIANSKCEKVQSLLILAKQYDEALSAPHIGHEEELMLLKENYETALSELLEIPSQDVSGMNDEASLMSMMK
jgi:hypothetical protein